jgi:methyl-accepting chemotaxis protein
MEADDIVDAIKLLTELTGRVVVAIERLEEKLDDLIFEAKQSNETLNSMDTSLNTSLDAIDTWSRELKEIASIARREFDPLRKR